MYLAGASAPDGTRLVSAEGVRDPAGRGDRTRPGPVGGRTGRQLRDGLVPRRALGRRAVFHPGNTPDTTTMLALFPDRGVAVAIVVNAGNELPVPGNPFIADRVARTWSTPRSASPPSISPRCGASTPLRPGRPARCSVPPVGGSFEPVRKARGLVPPQHRSAAVGPGSWSGPSSSACWSWYRR